MPIRPAGRPCVRGRELRAAPSDAPVLPLNVWLPQSPARPRRGYDRGNRRNRVNPKLPDIEALARIVRDAGEIVMSVYRQAFDVRSKSDASPVTAADERAEASH